MSKRARTGHVAALLALTCGCALRAEAVTGPHPRAAGLHAPTMGRSPGYLGIEFHDVPEESLGSLRNKGAHGVEVVMVDHDGPAGKAGLHPHDIIVSLNGQAVASAEAFHRMIHDAGAGMPVSLGLVRGGHSLTVTTQLADRDAVARVQMARLAAANTSGPQQTAPPGEASGVTEVNESYTVAFAPSPEPASPAPVAPAHTQGFISSMLHSAPPLGAVLDAMEPQLAGYFGAPQGQGLLVHTVVPDSPAAAAGLRAGDVVLRADLVALHTPADWTKHLRAAKGSPVQLTVLRDHREYLLNIRPEPKHHSLLEWPLHTSD